MAAKDWIFKKSDNAETEVAEQSGEPARNIRYFRPNVDIVEGEHDLVVYADVPGATKKDIHITVENGLLTIDAVPDIAGFDGLRAVYSEYHVGGYHRQFQVGESIDVEKIEADVNQGVLRLKLPKKEAAKTVRIQIK
ncbi:MAG: Hsp20/alpha crystallin family protein [Leptospiraceae bacterium]|nr:Hsp20/alpha crystallin family protein [Leptospiraceae bacterium]MCP5485910.1 Hsp20/alpha crystallin family protein [Spirochaetales bacterium]